MSLPNDFLYPQYLVMCFLCNQFGDLVEERNFYIFASRSSALSFIKTYEKQLLDELHSDSFDSYTDALSPAFRLYHLTRAKF